MKKITGGGYDNHHPMFSADSSALLPAAGFFAVLAERELERLAVIAEGNAKHYGDKKRCRDFTP